MREYQDIRSYDIDELRELMTGLGEKPFKAGQLYEWLHKKQASSYEEMTNLSKVLRKRLQEEHPLWKMEAVQVQTSRIDGTKKFLFRLRDGYVIESVWMKYQHGNSVCISSRWAAGWAAVSVPPPSEGLPEIWSRRRCWNRSTGSGG